VVRYSPTSGLLRRWLGDAIQEHATLQDAHMRAGGGGEWVSTLADLLRASQEGEVFGRQEVSSTLPYCEGSGIKNRELCLLREATGTAWENHRVGCGCPGGKDANVIV